MGGAEETILQSHPTVQINFLQFFFHTYLLRNFYDFLRPHFPFLWKYSIRILIFSTGGAEKTIP